MRAKWGDRVLIKAHHLGEPIRDGEILEVPGPRGEPPYLVRWLDDGHMVLLVPLLWDLGRS